MNRFRFRLKISREGDAVQLLIIALVAWGIYCLQRMVYNARWNQNLDVHITFEKEQVMEREHTYLTEEVVNDKWLPLPMLFLKFKLKRCFHFKGEQPVVQDDCATRNDLLHVMMKQCLRRRIEVWCDRRGRYTIGQVSVLSKSLFLDADYLEERTCDSTITVYPRFVDAKRFMRMIDGALGEQLLRASMQEDPFLKRGIREYQIYDQPRSINWTATARSGAMKVNLLETTQNQKGYVFLNMHPHSLSVAEEVMEEGIRLAKSLCYLFSQRGIASGLWTNGTNGRSIDPICVEGNRVGVKYLSEVDEALTSIVSESGQSRIDGRDCERSFIGLFQDKMEQMSQEGMVVIISNEQDVEIQRFLRQLKDKGRHFLWIVPVANTTDFERIAALESHMYLWRLNYEV